MTTVFGRSSLLFAAMFAASPVLAASLPFFTDQAAFDAAIGGAPGQVETFAGIPTGTRLDLSTTFSTGVMLNLDRTAADTFVVGEALRLSIENPYGRDALDQTRVAEFTLPNLSSYFGIEFGIRGGPAGGVGNDSGTILSLLKDGNILASYDLGDLTPDQPDGQHVGFLGYFDGSSRFDVIRFSSAGRGTKNDDDFFVDNLAFESSVAAVPLPASALMLLVALGTMGALAYGRRNPA